MRLRFVIAAMLLTGGLLLSAAAFKKTDDQTGFLEKRAALVVRQIGHKLLLHAGDAGSRIPPVTRLSDAIFQVEFQNRFSFTPDTLVMITQRELLAYDLPLNYMVSVFDCATGSIVYGFEIRPEKKDLVPCLGRIQPKGCYFIQVAFLELSKADDPLPLYLLPFVVIAGLILLVLPGKAFKVQAPGNADDHAIAIGKYLFDRKSRILKHGAEIIALSDKETKLLAIFSASQNHLLTRNHLLAEGWENEGVFTGRSLDMFVSKLRKKMRLDPSVRITNVHGKGYMLESPDPSESD